MPKTRRPKKIAAGASTIPYARGFRPPTPQQSSNAILGGRARGPAPAREKAPDAGSLERAVSPGDDFFSPVPRPTSVDDWLAQYNETGQTYSQFLEECPWLSTRRRKYVRAAFDPRGKTLPDKYPGAKIYLLPLGGFDDTTAPSFSDLAEYARLFFCLPVEVLPAVDLRFESGSAFWIETSDPPSQSKSTQARRKSSRSQRQKLESRYHLSTGSIQLNVASILTKLRQIIPDDAICLMALTMADLFDTAPDLFVAGMAAGNQRVGVFSFCRYDPTLSFSTEFWYEMSSAVTMKKEERKKTILQRSCKLLVHEIAHLLGIDHCIWYSCCMNGSGHLEEDFSQSMHLCPVDLHKLHTLCGFDVVERYRGLQAFFEQQGMREEKEWVGRRVQFVTQDRK